MAKQDWQQVAYDNAYNALNQGQPFDVISQNQSKYQFANDRALAQWNADHAPRQEESHFEMPSAPVIRQAPEPINPPTPVNIPSLALTEGTSTVNQLNKLQSLDSLTMQQAAQGAAERGVASGEIHSSQQGGAAQRAITDKLTPLANSEASMKANEEISNWKAEVAKEMDRYDKEYAGYLAKLGFASNERMNMVQANTSLSNSLMGNMTSLFNNPDLVLGEAAMNNISQIFSTAMQNNNVILDMGFSYA